MLSKPKLLIVYELVSQRYETGAMLITSNRSVAEWGTVFADPVVATAILDRLLHHSRAKRNQPPTEPPRKQDEGV